MNRETLLNAALRFSTPLYVYDIDALCARVQLLRNLFEGHFGISYAIKANPNAEVLKALQPQVATFDASSVAEVHRALSAGMPANRISFSGPAKRPEELKGALDVDLGELVLESVAEARTVSAMAQERGRKQPCLVRINPLKVPRKFGASMAGTASQFGVDEETIGEVLPEIRDLPGIALEGFHIYSGTNCLDGPAIAENFGIFADIFRRAQEITDLVPRCLVFGAGFGVPYLPSEKPLDHEALPALVLPILEALRRTPKFARTEFRLELGRWLIGPCGWLLTRVISKKHSRGVDICACDAGFNNHLAACGMMGSVIRRNWIYQNISRVGGPSHPYTLVGPLCTTIDRLAVDVLLKEVSIGDVISVETSGAYGLTASPTRFISHPEPREVVNIGGDLVDASETLLNHLVPEEVVS